MNIYKSPLLLTAVIFFNQLSAGAQQTAVYRVADSLYAGKAYKQASEEYKTLVKDTSTDAFHLNRYGYSLYKTNHYPKALQYYNQELASHPNNAIKASVLSRLSMLYAHEDSTSRALEFLDSAISSGYFGIVELDSSEDFQNIRRNEGFIQLRN